MFTDAFIKCSADESAALLTRLTNSFSNHGLNKDGIMVLKKTLTFYKDAIYYDMTQIEPYPTRTLHLVDWGQDIFVCDGNESHLLAFNQKCPLLLDRTNILDYVRFYFAHVVGPHGLSRVIDTVDDLQLKEEPSAHVRKSLHDKIVPLVLNGTLTKGGYQARGTILVEQTMFSAFIDIQNTGAVTVELGRVLADLLPTSNRLLEA